LVLYAMAALFSLGSLLIIHSTGNLVALVATLAGVSGWFLTSRVHYEELSELKVHVSRALHSQRRVLANQILIRKVSGQLKEALDLERSRSEEHTSELQSRGHLVCRLLLEKKKKKKKKLIERQNNII